MAKQNMGAQDFMKVTSALTEVESLMAAAPKIEQAPDTLGGISSILGKSAGSVGKMADFYKSFSQLGLTQDMVDRFIPQILEYAKSRGGETVFNLCVSVLSKLPCILRKTTGDSARNLSFSTEK